jgi:hypothetical protein
MKHLLKLDTIVTTTIRHNNPSLFLTNARILTIEITKNEFKSLQLVLQLKAMTMQLINTRTK